jgi:mannose/cellobiose epimerase-like protein (N-acyl-D-glucosamine 2-epimerase family)
MDSLNIEQLKQEYEKALFDKFLPNMDAYVIDHELGGFMCSVNISTGELTSTNKKTWFEGRGIWVYSFLYNHFGKNPHYLEIARKSKDFILKLLPADDRFYFSEYSKEGTPISDIEGDIYGNLFVAEGLAEYSKASGEKQYLDLARKIILKAVQRYDSPDFYYPYKSESLQKGPRILGHWMILLSLATQMLRQEPDSEMEALAERCIASIMKHHLNPEYRLLNEALNHNLEPLSDEVASQFGDIGHGCETLAFVMNYAVLKRDAILFKESSEAFKRHVEISKDRVYGGYFLTMPNVDENVYELKKMQWLPEEILLGALTMIEHTGDEWALNTFQETETYLREKFVRPEYAFSIDSGDRKLEEYSLIRAENYHYPRQLMVSLLAFDRMISRGKKPSRIFG